MSIDFLFVDRLLCPTDVTWRLHYKQYTTHIVSIVYMYLYICTAWLWPDWANAQAILGLHWAHTHFVGFVMSRLILPCLIQSHDWSDQTSGKSQKLCEHVTGIQMVIHILCETNYSLGGTESLHLAILGFEIFSSHFSKSAFSIFVCITISFWHWSENFNLNLYLTCSSFGVD